MGLFGQMGDMYRLQKEAKRIKKELAKTHVFSEVDGCKVTVSGEQKVISVEFTDETILQNPKKASSALVEATNKAITKSQEIAAEKMKSIMGNFPGLGGPQQ